MKIPKSASAEERCFPVLGNGWAKLTVESLDGKEIAVITEKSITTAEGFQVRLTPSTL